jgi:DNA invertase Pin-like site-specific DNA recombinase
MKLCYDWCVEIVSYVRVSTHRQGASGLGLDAQRAAIETYCQQHGATVAKEYREVESGKNNDRKALRQAIVHAKRVGAKLVIGKLDRLARNVHFISGLMESNIDFVACDLPEANRLLLHIMAAVAENEAKAISDRTIAALQQAKARGTALGATNPKSRNLTDESRAAGARSTHTKALKAYAAVRPTIMRMRASGSSLAKIAAALKDEGHTTRTGKSWNAMQVSRVLETAQRKTAAFDRAMTPPIDAAARAAVLAEWVTANDVHDDAMNPDEG